MADPAKLDAAAIAADAWPGRRAGLWLTMAGTGLLVVGALASTTASTLITGPDRSATAPAVHQINEVALWIATFTTHASLVGGVLMGLGVTLFITWEPLLTGITNRMHRLQGGPTTPPRLYADQAADPADGEVETLETHPYE